MAGAFRCYFRGNAAVGGAISNLVIVVRYGLMRFMVYSLSLQRETFAFFSFAIVMYTSSTVYYLGKKPRFTGLKA